MEGITLTSVLGVGNLVLASANVIIAFSLLAYLLTHNFRSPVARGFCALITFVMIVYAGDIVLANVDSLAAAAPWLRFQWLGIAFVPAAYLQFSDALLRMTNAPSVKRLWLVRLAYSISLIFFVLAVATDLIVWDGVAAMAGVFHFKAGRLFWAFAVYFFLATGSGIINVGRARQRCLTPYSRRRMTYLTLGVFAPAMGVFPYLLITTMSALLSVDAILALTLVGNVGIALMTVLIGYSVAYQGALLPDRVIKHSLIHYLLRGPVVGTLLIFLMLVIPRVERILGLPRDTVLIFAVVLGIVLFQVGINLAKPYIDRLIYRKDRDEVLWIQELGKRLLTTTDLEQLLENILVGLCDLLRVPSGFIITMGNGRPQLQVFCGPKERALKFLRNQDWAEVLYTLSENHRSDLVSKSDFVLRDSYWLLALRDKGKAIVGILGVEPWGRREKLTDVEEAALANLVSRAERALIDIQLQREVFKTLQRLAPELEQIQRWRSIPRYAQSRHTEGFGIDLINTPEFPKMVKNALSHYWGGPKLSKSPLLQLQVVKKALQEHDGIATKALRAVLSRAIEQLKPEGERSMTSAEWVIYNILDLRFIQGQRIREIAHRLAMSESDFYRKQRIAIEEVARTLANMESKARRLHHRTRESSTNAK